MKFKIYSISLLFLLTGIVLNAQTDIRQFTLTVIDTSDNQYSRTLDIYKWITTNIRYDVKSFNKGEQRNLSPQQLLKYKKGLCSDYANLLQAMCNSVGIEAYVVNGYSKGYLYNKQKPFLRANHSWNIVFADSAWLIIDATWGSGFLSAKPSPIQKTLYSLVRMPYASKKNYFTQEPADLFFNILPGSLVKTHYPLDPKWLFNTSPPTFKSFVYDSVDETTDFPFFAQDIERIRHKSRELQFRAEGETSIIVNPLNNFDLANSYFNQAASFAIERNITKGNLWQFEKYYNQYSIIIESISKHKTVTDSVYRSRAKSLRQVARDQKRLTGRITSKARKARKTLRSSQKQITGKNSSYRKKMNGYLINIGRAEIKKIPLVIKNETTYTDTVQIVAIKKELYKLKTEQLLLNNMLDSLIKVVDNFSYMDAQIDDSISRANQIFNTNIEILGTMILTGEESIITDYVDSLKVIYKEIEDFIGDKKSAKSDLQNTGRKFYSTTGLLQKNTKREMTLNVKLQKLANNSDSVVKAYNRTIDELIICYKKSIAFTKKLSNHNELQTDIRQENMAALKKQKKSIKQENRFFVAWHENLARQEKAEYTKEKETIKSIKGISLKNKKNIELKLQKHNE